MPLARRLPLLLLAVMSLVMSCHKETNAEREKLTLELTEAGAEPRKPLRSTPKVGLKESLVMTMKMEMNLEGVPTNEVPLMVMTMDTEVTKVVDNGNFHITFELTKVEALDEGGVAPKVLSDTREMLNNAIGLRGRQTMSDRGIALSTKITMPPDMPPQMKQMMKSMMGNMDRLMNPWPKEPVGIGARWTTTMPIEMNGMELVQTANYEVEDIQGSVVTLKMAITQHAESQTLKQPGMPEVKITSVETQGSGSMTIDTTKIVPTSNLDMTSLMLFKTAGQAISMTMKMRMDVKGM
jgi:hypothetical protein